MSMIEPDLKTSVSRVGYLYPMLVDNNGIIIDGEYRFKANKNWKKVKLSHIRTEKDRLIVRIVANNVRRTVSLEEKSKLLNSLGEVLMNEGVEPGRIAYMIAKETGMSYRWVTKYLSIDYKSKLQSLKAKSAAKNKTEILNYFSTPLKKVGTVVVKSYANTPFVTFTVKKDFYLEFQKISSELGIPTETSILKALEKHMGMMRQAVRLKNSFVPSENDNKEQRSEIPLLQMEYRSG